DAIEIPSRGAVQLPAQLAAQRLGRLGGRVRASQTPVSDLMRLGLVDLGGVDARALRALHAEQIAQRVMMTGRRDLLLDLLIVLEGGGDERRVVSALVGPVRVDHHRMDAETRQALLEGLHEVIGVAGVTVERIRNLGDRPSAETLELLDALRILVDTDP